MQLERYIKSFPSERPCTVVYTSTLIGKYSTFHPSDSSQVAWLGKENVDATWVCEHTLPKNVVEEYEHGVQTGIAVHQMVQCGPLFSTAYVERVQEDSAEPPSKKARLKEWNAPETTG